MQELQPCYENAKLNDKNKYSVFTAAMRLYCIKKALQDVQIK